MAQQPNQQDFLPPPPAPAPANGGNRGGGVGRFRRQRRGGRGAGAPRERQPPMPVPNGTAPRPQHLATVSTPERNDPLWSIGAGEDCLPAPNIHYIFPGCEALPTVCAVIHQEYVTASPSYSRRVSSSAFGYYAAVVTYSRLLSLHLANGEMLSPDEERFCEQVASLQLEAPLLLAHFLSGFGNTRLPCGREFLFRMLDRTDYQRTTLNVGWFGRVDCETQPLYQGYPCLAVYAERMLASLAMRSDENQLQWRLPEAIIPDVAGAVRPSAAFIGYGPRERLTPGQRALLEGAGIMAGEQFPTANPSLPLSFSLLRSVHNELKAVSSRKLAPLPTSLSGSVAQLCTVRVEAELTDFTTERACSLSMPFRLAKELCLPATAFCYRVVHSVDSFTGTQLAPWCVWTYQNSSADGWTDIVTAGNAARQYEPDILNAGEFRVSSYIVESRLKALDSAINRVT